MTQNRESGGRQNTRKSIEVAGFQLDAVYPPTRGRAHTRDVAKPEMPATACHLPPAERFVIELEAGPAAENEAPTDVRVRRAIKHLSRFFRLKCVSIREIRGPMSEPQCAAVEINQS